MLSVAVTLADIEPKQHKGTDSVTYTKVATGAPCTVVHTPGSWYCGSCWFYECGCACVQADFNQTTSTGTCSVIVVYGGYYTSCENLKLVSTTKVKQQLCYDPNAGPPPLP